VQLSTRLRTLRAKPSGNRSKPLENRQNPGARVWPLLARMPGQYFVRLRAIASSRRRSLVCA